MAQDMVDRGARNFNGGLQEACVARAVNALKEDKQATHIGL